VQKETLRVELHNILKNSSIEELEHNKAHIIDLLCDGETAIWDLVLKHREKILSIIDICYE